VNAVPDLPLNSGTTIPQLGFGVFQIPPEETAAAVTTALEIGYRHIDTAQMYKNEEGVGEAVASMRSDVFVTSKLNNGFHRPDDARREFDKTLERLKSDYVDMFLIHWPLPTLYDGDYVSTWKTLGEFLADGRAKAIGVSNFQVAHLERLGRGDRRGARGEPDRGPPVLRQRGGPRVRREARHPHRGLGADREGQGARGPGRHRARSGRGPHPGAGRAPLAHPARRHRVPQVGDAVADAGELRDLDFTLDDAQMQAITGLSQGEDGRDGPVPDEFDYVPD
jgi:2,5-diketo-D-gluconate reductase A